MLMLAVSRDDYLRRAARVADDDAALLMFTFYAALPPRRRFLAAAFDFLFCHYCRQRRFLRRYCRRHAVGGS